MVPNTPQPQPLEPASLPAMPAQSLPPVGPVPVQPVNQAPLSAVDPSVAAALQARQLVERYAQDPYQLAESINQLKGSYVAQRYHIAPNVAGN